MAVDVSNTEVQAVAKKLYEGMFLVDSAEAAGDWDGVNATIKNILERAEAEILSMEKWDERYLAYKIGGKSRGTYILSYFRADGGRIQDIEREVRLSEKIMRVLILCAEGRERPEAEKGEQEAAEAATVDAKAEQVAAGGAVKESEKPKKLIKRRKRRSKATEATAEAGESEQAQPKADAEESGEATEQ